VNRENTWLSMRSCSFLQETLAGFEWVLSLDKEYGLNESWENGSHFPSKKAINWFSWLPPRNLPLLRFWIPARTIKSNLSKGTFSLPARSTRFSFPRFEIPFGKLWLISKIKRAWLLELYSFILVDRTVLVAIPVLSTSNNSCSEAIFYWDLYLSASYYLRIG